MVRAIFKWSELYSNAFNRRPLTTFVDTMSNNTGLEMEELSVAKGNKVEKIFVRKVWDMTWCDFKIGRIKM